MLAVVGRNHHKKHVIEQRRNFGSIFKQDQQYPGKVFFMQTQKERAFGNELAGVNDKAEQKSEDAELYDARRSEYY